MICPLWSPRARSLQCNCVCACLPVTGRVLTLTKVQAFILFISHKSCNIGCDIHIVQCKKVLDRRGAAERKCSTGGAMYVFCGNVNIGQSLFTAYAEIGYT